MSRKKLTEEELEAIRFENEFLKAKIIAEFGAESIYINPELELTPELVNEFLKCITASNGDMDDVSQVPVYDYLGRPPFARERDLDDERLLKELDRVLQLLYDKKILCDSFYPVDDRVFYKFITEELFQQLIWDIPDPEIGTHYFYESFHPNHAGETHEMCEVFLRIFFSDDFHIRIREYMPEKIRNFVELSDFLDCFTGFANVEYEVLKADAAPNVCYRTASVRFDAITDKGMAPIHYEGKVQFELEYIDGMWVAIRVTFPGMPDA